MVRSFMLHAHIHKYIHPTYTLFSRGCAYEYYKIFWWGCFAAPSPASLWATVRLCSPVSCVQAGVGSMLCSMVCVCVCLFVCVQRVRRARTAWTVLISVRVSTMPRVTRSVDSVSAQLGGPETTVSMVIQQQQQPFNGPLSGTTRVSRYKKGKTSLDLLEQETVSGSGISWTM